VLICFAFHDVHATPTSYAWWVPVRIDGEEDILAVMGKVRASFFLLSWWREACGTQTWPEVTSFTKCIILDTPVALIVSDLEKEGDLLSQSCVSSLSN
jgi:hypothetical protein